MSDYEKSSLSVKPKKQAASKDKSRNLLLSANRGNKQAARTVASAAPNYSEVPISTNTTSTQAFLKAGMCNGYVEKLGSSNRNNMQAMPNIIMNIPIK